MNSSFGKIRGAHAVVLTALLLGSAINSRAQQVESEPVDAPAVEQTGDEAQEQEQDTPPTTAEEADQSPFDYQSSEQISEDLSVSYPVDI
jgi:hypothetical protein